MHRVRRGAAGRRRLHTDRPSRRCAGSIRLAAETPPYRNERRRVPNGSLRVACGIGLNGGPSPSQPFATVVVVGEDPTGARWYTVKRHAGLASGLTRSRSDGSGVGAANRLKFSCQPTIVGRPGAPSRPPVIEARERACAGHRIPLHPPKTSSSVPHDDWYPPAGASADRTRARWSNGIKRVHVTHRLEISSGYRLISRESAKEACR